MGYCLQWIEWQQRQIRAHASIGLAHTSLASAVYVIIEIPANFDIMYDMLTKLMQCISSAILYATRPRLLKYLASVVLAVSATGAFGGAALMTMQPEILADKELQMVWWYPTVESAKSNEFIVLTVMGVLLSSTTFYAALGMLKPKKMKKDLMLVILFAQIALSLFYSFLGTAFNIIRIIAYSLCFIYICRPKVRAYLEYIHHY
jgi:hypothetical protein